jgi:hypothetical protein
MSLLFKATLPLAVFLLTGCNSPAPSSSVAPTTPSTLVTGLTIDGVPPALEVDQSVQLTASVVLPGGTKKLTSGVSWKSSDPAVATISSAGVLTAVGFGTADITASAYEHDAFAHLRVPVSITGLVHESMPTETTPVPGARVEIQEETGGAIATTDSSGRFTLEVATASATLIVTKEGYDSRSVALSGLTPGLRPDIGLVPNGPPVRSAYSGALCTVAAWLSPGLQYSPPCWGTNYPYPLEAHHRFPVHRSGIATITVKYRYVGDYYANNLRVQLLCSGQVVLEKQIANRWDFHSIGAFEAALPQPCLYQVRLSDYIADRKGGHWTTYSVDVEHPK